MSRSVQVLNSEERNTDVVFAAAVEVLQAHFVLDGDNNLPARREEAGHCLQVVLKRILTIGEQRRVLQHSDQKYAVKELICFEAEKVILHDANIGELPAALRGDTRPKQASFDCNHVRTHLSEKASDRPAAAP